MKKLFSGVKMRGIFRFITSLSPREPVHVSNECGTSRSVVKGIALTVILAVCSLLAVAQPAVAAGAPDSKGTDFWVAFNKNYSGESTLSLFIAGETATTGTVTVPGLAFSKTFSVTPGAVTTVLVPSAAMLNATDGVENLGIHVTSVAEVTVYGLNRIPYTTDAYLGLPTDILGTEYIVLAWGGSGYGGSEFAVVGTQDGTIVTITPSTPLDIHPAGTPYTVSLNQGQVYQFIASNSSADVSGTVVTSNKPVAVFGGHTCANIPNSGTYACDHVIEEIPPTATWGKSFVTEPLATRTVSDTFRILATQDNTNVIINGASVATLNRGQFTTQQISPQVPPTGSTITATGPVLVAQYSNGSSWDGVTSDPFMMLIPPYEQFLASYTVTAPASGFAHNYINVVAPNEAVGNIILDGTAIPALNFTPIAFSGFSGAQMPIALGSHTLSGALPFGAFVYGFDSYDSYGYPGGLSLAPIARVASLTLSPKTTAATLGTQACVNATVLDQNKKPLAGVRVDFKVTGVNPTSGFQFSNSTGVAQFCYKGTNGGIDTVTGSVGTFADTATVTWISVVAKLNMPSQVYVGQPFQADASASFTTAPNGKIVSYQWDWNGDGIYDQTTTTPLVAHTYTSLYLGSVGLKVTDNLGNTSTTTAKVTAIKYASAIGNGTLINSDFNGDFFRTSVKVAYNATTPVTGKIEYYAKGGPNFISINPANYVVSIGEGGKAFTFSGTGLLNNAPCKFTFSITENNLKNSVSITVTDLNGIVKLTRTAPVGSVAGYTQLIIQ